MPKQVEKDTWVATFKELLEESFGKDSGWYVTQSRGRMRLQVVDQGKNQTRTLPYEWKKSSINKALPRIQQIYKRYIEANGKITLVEACEITESSSSKHDLDWDQLVAEFRPFVPNASDATWKKSYLPVLNRAGRLLQRKNNKPSNGEKLLMESLVQWEQGSRSRQIAKRSLRNFLQWAVTRGKLIAAYAPPAAIPEIRKPKRIGFALNDAQILRIIDFEEDQKWKFAIQLCAVYGLRPEELRYLRVKDKELWSIYQKSKGGTKGAKTEPRRLHPLFLVDSEGKTIDWKLQSRIKAGESLPPLGQEGKGGEALRTHLRRKLVWQSLKKEAEHIGEVLVPYAFRHRYAKASHAAGFPVSNIAAAMGHTLEVHLESYARFIPDGTADLYAKRNTAKKRRAA